VAVKPVLNNNNLRIIFTQLNNLTVPMPLQTQWHFISHIIIITIIVIIKSVKTDTLGKLHCIKNDRELQLAFMSDLNI